MLTDIAMLLTDVGLMMACIWLYARRENFQKWIYLLLAFTFASFAIGIWPGYELANQLGFVLLVAATSIQIAAHVFVEKMEEHGFDVCHGKMIEE